MEILLFWLGFSVLAGAIYRNKGRSFWIAFLVSVVLSPLIGIILAVASGPARRCPYCNEAIHPAAAICPHCRSSLAGGGKRERPMRPLYEPGQEGGVDL